MFCPASSVEIFKKTKHSLLDAPLLFGISCEILEFQTRSFVFFFPYKLSQLYSYALVLVTNMQGCRNRDRTMHRTASELHSDDPNNYKLLITILYGVILSGPYLGLVISAGRYEIYR